MLLQIKLHKSGSECVDRGLVDREGGFLEGFADRLVRVNRAAGVLGWGLTPEYTNVLQMRMQGHAITKTVRITRALNVILARRARAEKKDFSEVWREAVVRGLRESEGIDMAGALHGIIGKYEGSGEGQQSRMSRYGRARHR